MNPGSRSAGRGPGATRARPEPSGITCTRPCSPGTSAGRARNAMSWTSVTAGGAPGRRTGGGGQYGYSITSRPAAPSTDGSQVSLFASSCRCGDRTAVAVGASRSPGRSRLQNSVNASPSPARSSARVRSTPARITTSGLAKKGPPPRTGEDPQERREGWSSRRFRSCAILGTALRMPSSPAFRLPFVRVRRLLARFLLCDLRIARVRLAQRLGWIALRLCERAEQVQDVADARQVDALLTRQVLDHLQLAQVALRIAPAVRARAERRDQPHVLIEHQRALMRLQDLRGDADRVEGLVQVERVVQRTHASSRSHPSTPRARSAGVVW